ncbi:MAG: penicillin-binding transpeptidase domain-containing protein [Clostridia bacterium]|nr:penicillin-binding transpeptidase domain-containing protein [Clostridia bacterium]
MKNRPRYIVLSIVIIGVFALIWLRMYDLQIVMSESYAEQAQSKTTRTISVVGSRGTIYDANMIPLAYDKLSYDVQFYRDPSLSSDEDRASFTQSIIETIKIIEANGKTTIDEFWLKKDEDGVWRFNSGATSPTTEATRESQWRSNFYLTSTPEEELFDTLCRNYSIPEDLDEEFKVKILSIWQRSRMYNFLSEPVTIAEDVGFEVVSKIEVRSNELEGMSIRESSSRVYPKGAIASHIIGYTSKISGTETLANYRAMGYPTDATVGQTGIEYSMEDQLTPYLEYRQGSRVVEVNNRGKIIREISYQAPVDGNDVILTIDTQLQAVLEDALARNIDVIREGEEQLMLTTTWRANNQQALLEYERSGREVDLATSGAAVAMDPNTGRILAMASYPTFDLSEFEGGAVSMDYWREIYNNEDNPLYNRAISARDTPGSCFKMVTALGALMEGYLTLDDQISDGGEFDTGDVSNRPTCWIAPSQRYKHANQTVVEGLKNSCNYFFYTIGSSMGIDNLTKWAALLGLTSRTSIELPNESTSFVGNQLMLYDSNRAVDDQYTSKPYFASVMMKRLFRQIGEDRGIEYDEDRLDIVVKKILDIVNEEGDKSTWPSKIRTILLDDMNLPVSYLSNKLINGNFIGNTIQSYINDLRWTASETVMAAIGQSITQITPVAAARYVSAICNGGKVYNAQIVDKIVSPTGNVVLDKEPVMVNYISGADAYLEAIQEGMQEVTSVENDGTAASQFAKSTAQIAAKTGTAEKTDIDLENNSWLVTYAPYDTNPEIVVVVYIQNGYAGARSASTAIKTIEYYLQQQAKTEILTVQTGNEMSR